MAQAQIKQSDTVRIGVSACLLGQKVRYDGGHKRNVFVCDELKPFVQFVPMCPEFEIGLGVPREPIHLLKTKKGIRLTSRDGQRDHTAAMLRYARRQSDALKKQELHGFIFKKDSPSCGMERVRIHGGKGAPLRQGVGLFAGVFRERHPLIPVEEEGRLQDPLLRTTFIESVFAYRRLQALWAGPGRLRDLVEFHTREKLFLLARNPQAYRTLGQWVAGAKKRTPKQVREGYEEMYMKALRQPATRHRHVNTLQHMAGYLKKLISPEDRRELADLIVDFQRGHLPLLAPLTLLRHHVRVCRVDYLARQVYLSPHPKELFLRAF